MRKLATIKPIPTIIAFQLLVASLVIYCDITYFHMRGLFYGPGIRRSVPKIELQKPIEGIEPSAHGVMSRYSNQLSYIGPLPNSLLRS